MIILEDLQPEEREKYVNNKPYSTNNRLLNINKPCVYKSVFTNIFMIKSQLTNKSIAENTFEVTLLEEHNNYYDFDINTKSSEIKSGLEFIPDIFKTLLDKMSSLKNHLVLRISKNGTIKEVLNQNELANKWLVVKDEILTTKSSISEKDINKIIKSGELEYLSSSTQMANDMRKMVVYKTFFNSFIDIQAIKSSNNIFKQEFNSSIFSDIDIEVETQIAEEPISEEDANIIQTFSSRDINVNRSKIKRLFLNNYAILKESFKDYNYNSIAINNLNKDTLWPVSVNFGSKEIINNSVSIEMEVNIERIR